MSKERLITLALIILAAAASRLLPHPSNVAPITAIALFAGAHFTNRKLAFAIPLVAMLLSDLIIGFYAQMWITYLAFAVIVCIGFGLQGRVRPASTLGASLLSSVVFFLITNFALWSHYDLYPQTLEGVMQGYVAALPFLGNSVLGDLFYTALIFGGFALAERKCVRLKAASA